MKKCMIEVAPKYTPVDQKIAVFSAMQPDYRIGCTPDISVISSAGNSTTNFKFYVKI